MSGAPVLAAAAVLVLNSPNTNSSLNETLDSPQVKAISDECAKALSAVLEEHPDAVGVAIVVNGAIEEVNIYPNHRLLGKLYPRLLQSYAVQAAMHKDKAEDAPALSGEDLKQFLTERQEKSRKEQNVNRDNRFLLRDLDKKVVCETAYEGKPVHRQWMSKSPDTAVQGGRDGGMQGQELILPNQPPRPAPEQNRQDDSRVPQRP